MVARGARRLGFWRRGWGSLGRTHEDHPMFSPRHRDSRFRLARPNGTESFGPQAQCPQAQCALPSLGSEREFGREEGILQVEHFPEVLLNDSGDVLRLPLELTDTSLQGWIAPDLNRITLVTNWLLDLRPLIVHITHTGCRARELIRGGRFPRPRGSVLSCPVPATYIRNGAHNLRSIMTGIERQNVRKPRESQAKLVFVKMGGGRSVRKHEKPGEGGDPPWSRPPETILTRVPRLPPPATPGSWPYRRTRWSS